MEVEAKFSIPDEQTFERLRRLEEITGYRVQPAGVKQVDDRYLDTRDRAIMAAGYACRVRRKESGHVATLKGLGGADAESGIHERAEYEVPVGDEDPNRWPESRARELALQLSGGRPLREIFSLSQERHVFLVSDDRPAVSREIAELSLDVVYPVVAVDGDRQRVYYELEMELLDQGSEYDLHVLTRDLQEVWGLQPEPRSKFERGLELVDAVSQSGQGGEGLMEELLTAEERSELEYWIENGSPPMRRRARIVLLHGTGHNTATIASEVGLSQRQVRRWLAEFRESGMGIFPAPGDEFRREVSIAVAQEEQAATVATLVVPPTQAPETEVEEPASTEPIAIEELRAGSEVDPQHADYVKRMALELFDLTCKVHGLSPERRSTLEAAAGLIDLGRDQAGARRHLIARDMILAQRIVGFSPAEQDMLASIVAFQRKKIRPHREEAFLRLPEALQETTLALAALLRMAVGLDASRTQSTAVNRIESQDGCVTFIVEGPESAQDCVVAQRRSDLWDKRFDVNLRFMTEEQFVQAPVVIASGMGSPALPELAAPGLLPDDPMSEAGRKTLWFHFLRMLKHEPGTRLGEDIEELHDMRVATRRMRAAIRVFGDFFEPEVIRSLNKEIRRVTRALGPVRDLDVFEEKAMRYLQDLPEGVRYGLDPLLETWRAQRAETRADMLTFLDSERYEKFKCEFAEFLQTEGAGARSVPYGQPVPYQVRHVAPRLIYTRYEQVRAYETVLDGAQIETLHALRIDCKYLRYTLEFLEEVLGPEGEAVIDEVKAMQDHLGDLNDAEVAIGMLSEFLAGLDAAQADVPLTQRRSGEGIVNYLASRHAEKHRLVVTFPDAWDRLNREEVRRWLALAIVAL
jgi:CHAD domain-containing protein